MRAHSDVFERLGMHIAVVGSLKCQQTVVFRVIGKKHNAVRSDRMRIVDFVCQYTPLTERICQILIVNNLVVITVCDKVRIFYFRDVGCHI